MRSGAQGQNIPKVAPSFKHSPQHVASQGGTGASQQHRRSWVRCEGFHGLFLQFLLILWSIYTNIKVLFIDDGVRCAFKARGRHASSLRTLDRWRQLRAQ